MGTHYIVHLKQSCMYIYTLIMASDVSFRELLIKGSKPYYECEIHINMQYQNGGLALNHSYFDAPFRMCHLSGIFLETLQKRQADLSISKRDVLCVQIAALCRNLGQGPFSYLFEELVLPKIRASGKHWKVS